MSEHSCEVAEKLCCTFCKVGLVDALKIVLESGEPICDMCSEEFTEKADEPRKLHNSPVLIRRKTPKMSEFPPANKNQLNGLFLNSKVEEAANEALQKLERFVESVPSKLRDFESFDEREHIEHYCDLLEVQVIEEIDSIVKHLNEIGNDLLKQIREYRAQCLDLLKTRTSSDKAIQDDESSKIKEELAALAKDMKDFSEKWNDYFSLVDAFVIDSDEIDTIVTDSDIESALNKTKHFETRMQSLDAKRRSHALGGEIMKFRATHSFLGEHDPLRNLFNISIDRTDQRIQPKSLATMNAHLYLVQQVIFLSKDRIASCSEDKTIKIWNVENRTQLFELTGHVNWVNSIVMLQNGWLASGSSDKAIMIWDLEQQRPVKTLYGHTTSVVSLQTLQNGNLVSCSIDDTVRIWNPFVKRGNLILTITGHGNKKWIIPFGILSNDNVVTCSRDNDSKEDCVLRVWNPNDGGAQISTVSTGCTGVWSLLALSNDQVALGFMNGTIKIVDLTDSSRTRTREQAHNGFVTSLERMKLSGNLISCGRDQGDQSIKLWNVLDLSLLQTVSAGHCDFVTSMCISPNGEFLATASGDRTIKLWSLISA